MKSPICVVAASALALSLAIACRDSLLTAPAGPTNPQLTVVGGPFVIRQGQWIDSVDIPYRFVNRTSAPVASIGCFPPMPPRLQWWNGNAWVYAYGEIEPACSSPPFVIAPGASFLDTLRVRVFADSIGPGGSSVAPWWLGPRAAGQYRLIA